MRVELFGLVLLLSSCAADIKEKQIELDEVVDQKRELVKSAPSAGKLDYVAEGKKAQVEWLACKKPDATKSILLVNPNDRAFAAGTFCDQDWAAQTFLGLGYNVVAVNRPGFGGTTPAEKDFGGPASVAAVNAVWMGASKKAAVQQPRVIWATGVGTIAAVFFSKNRTDVDQLVLGSGVYDAEEFLAQTNDAGLKAELVAARDRSKDSAFMDKRSIAWDLAGLPKKFILYHGEKDEVVPKQQAETMKDSLAANQTEVKLELLMGIGYAIPENKHRLVLETLLKQ